MKLNLKSRKFDLKIHICTIVRQISFRPFQNVFIIKISVLEPHQNRRCGTKYYIKYNFYIRSVEIIDKMLQGRFLFTQPTNENLPYWSYLVQITGVFIVNNNSKMIIGKFANFLNCCWVHGEQMPLLKKYRSYVTYREPLCCINR